MKKFSTLLLAALIVLTFTIAAQAQSKALKVFEFPLESGCINTFLLKDSVLVRVTADQEYDDVKPTGCYPEPVVVAKKIVPPPVIIKDCPTKEFQVFFDFDKSNIRPDGKKTLNEIISYIKGCAGPVKIILSQGNCDNRGTELYNIKLGMRRAKTVASALIGLGIKADKINLVTYGESNATGKHQYDRRVDIVINP